MSVLLSTVFALPLSYFTTRFQFRGSIIIQSLGFIPLIMPPFVGAVALKLLFGTNGTVNLFLNKYSYQPFYPSFASFNQSFGFLST